MPSLGRMSDNCCSKFGRRRPFILGTQTHFGKKESFELKLNCVRKYLLRNSLLFSILFYDTTTSKSRFFSFHYFFIFRRYDQKIDYIIVFRTFQMADLDVCFCSFVCCSCLLSSSSLFWPGYAF